MVEGHEQMKTIHVAMIMHEFGATGFAASTEESLYEQLLGWCDDPESPHRLEGTNKEKVESYFDAHQEEMLFIDTCKIDDSRVWR